MRKLFFLFPLFLFGFFFNSCEGDDDDGMPVPSTVMDSDGQMYPTLIMADGKEWLGQNLLVNVNGSACLVGCATYGREYTWVAAKQACATLGDGWKLPSVEDWEALLDAYGERASGSESTSIQWVTKVFSDLVVNGASGFDVLPGASETSQPGDRATFFWTNTRGKLPAFPDAIEFIYFHQTDQFVGELRIDDDGNTARMRCRCVKN